MLFSNIKGLIFDFDGVISDTVPVHFYAWKKLFETNFNIRFGFEEYEKHVDGKPRKDGILSVIPNISDEDLKKACDLKQKYFLEQVKNGKSKIFDTTLRFLLEVKKKYPKVKFAVGSSSKNAKELIKYNNIDYLFSAIVSGNDIKNGKPNPEIFLKCSEKINIEPKNCIVFEDSISGIEAGNRGGFFTIGINRKNNDNNYKDADLVITDFKDLDIKLLNFA